MPKQRPSSVKQSSSDGWIVTTSLHKPDPQTRQFIRSHVMRGKNTRHDRRSRRLARMMAEDGREDSLEEPARSVQAPGDVGPLVVTTPGKIASELSLFGYKVQMQPYMLDLIYRAMTMIKPASFTVEDAIVQHKFNGLFCYPDLSQSPAMIHSILYTAHAFRDMLLGSPTGHVARLHLAQALYHLQQSIMDQTTATTRTTMSIVILLASTTAFLGDFETSQKHMDGLHKLVTLRGGLKSLGYGTMEQYKAQRLDFAIALATGGQTKLFDDEILEGPYPVIDLPAVGLPELGTSDPRLLNLWAELRTFSRAANVATETGVKMPTSFFLRFVGSVPGRLTNLRLDPFSTGELLRLCMLAYLRNIILHGNSAVKQMAYLSEELKAALLAHETPASPEIERLQLWSLFVARLSVFVESDGDWLQGLLIRTISSLGLRDWSDIREVLKSFLWVDVVFDTPAKELFDKSLAIVLVAD